jgi:PAS domain S-box-containing protein
VFCATPDGVLLAANSAGRRIFGYTEEEILRLSRADVVAVEDVRVASAADRRASEGSFRGPLTLVRKGGERFEAQVSSAQVTAPDGEPRVWLLVHDLTAQRHADEAARARVSSEESLRALSEATFEGVVLHRDGIILLTNAATEAMFGAVAGGLIGRRLFDFIAPETHADVRKRITDRFEDPYEGIGVRIDGTRFPAEVHARTGAIHFRGEPTRVVAIRDITVRKQLEASLALADRMASVGTLAAGVAHEINNPLAILMLNLELALRQLARPDTLDATQRGRLVDGLTDARASAERVQRIVRDLKTLSRPVEETSGPIDLPRVVEYARGIARYEIRHRARFDVEADEVPLVLGSTARVEQVVLNLLINASQAIVAGAVEAPRIVLRVREHSGDRVAIEVSDNGAGIPPELRSRIFEPFVTTKPVGVGTGLGLSICHSIVTSLGGTIELESDVGKGSTFRVLLPRAERTRGASPKREVTVPPAAPLPRGRVLLIDDEAQIRTVVMKLLAVHEVVAVSDAAAAVGLLEAGERFDVILCDLMLPGMSGVDFLEVLGTRWPALADRLVFITGGAVTERAKRGLESAKNPPLEKPFSGDALAARVDALLRL